MSLNLSHFSLVKVSFEIRYDNAYLFWDKAGHIGEASKSLWPKIKIVSGEPGKVAFKIENKYLIQVELGKAFIIAYKPHSSLKDYIEMAENLEAIVRKELGISIYTRLGFRPFYYKKYAKSEDATKDLLDIKKTHYPTGKHFNIEGKPTKANHILRWEADKIGLLIQLTSEGQKYEFEPPMEADEITPISIERNGILFNIDYYTLGSINVNQLNVTDWIKNAYHLIKRDSKVFLEK